MTQQNDTLLDLAEAMRFIEINPPIPDCHGLIEVELSGYKRATPDALEFLGKQGYNGWVFIGLVELNLATAQALGGWDASLIFNNIRNLDVEVAAILSDSQNSLCFDNESLGTIISELARELAKLRNLLSLRIERLSLAAAHELAEHPHELTLLLDTPPDMQVLQALCFHAGYSLQVSWIRRSGDASCDFSSTNKNKRVFVLPHFNDLTEQWHEHVYIGDLDFYPDLPVSEDGRIWEDGVIRLL